VEAAHHPAWQALARHDFGTELARRGLGRTTEQPPSSSSSDGPENRRFSSRSLSTGARRRHVRGRLLVDGALIHKDSTLRQINRAKTGALFQRGHVRGLYRYETDGFSVVTEFGHDGSLTEFSITPIPPQEPTPAPE
jgi:hypothetical protein